MRAPRTGCGTVGAVAVAAALLACAAGEGPAPSAGAPAPARAPAPGPACHAEPDPADSAAVAAMVEALRRLPPPRSPDGEAIVSLDNRGYGYAPSRGPFDLPSAPPR
jgi:hypothetical protein